MFTRWQKCSSAATQILAVELPGHGRRVKDAFFTDFRLLAQAAAQALIPHLGASFVLFGHSMGALLAFEVARELEFRMGRSCISLIVAGARAPHLRALDRSLHTLQRDELIEELRSMNGTPSELLQNNQAMDFLLPIIRSDLRLLATYVPSPGPKLRCPIAAFGGVDDPSVTSEQLLEWRKYTSNRFSAKMMRGDHFFLTSSADELVHEIRRFNGEQLLAPADSGYQQHLPESVR
jgi:medium-chain acyl-[acyl-carrier-protein] hydrolase